MRYKFTVFVAGLILGWWSVWLLLSHAIKRSFASLEASESPTWLQAQLEVPGNLSKVAVLLLGGTIVLGLIGFLAELSAKKK